MSELSDRVEDVAEDVDLERAWAVTVAGLAAVLALGALLFPGRVYDRFLWKYFWGPVAADGNGAECAVRRDGEVQYLQAGCEAAEGVVAYPGYTTVSTVSYALVLVLLLIGVYFLLERLRIGREVSMLYPLFPWVLFGGALRTLEDASVRFLAETGDPLVPFPYSAAIISPFIYVTVFVLTVLAILAGFWALRRGYVETWERPVAAAGSVLFLATVGYLISLALRTERLELNLAFLAVVVLGALAIAGGVWVLTERRAPVVNEATGFAGVLIVFGHAVDGIANVLSLDHPELFGIPGGYTPKHVVNSGIRTITRAIQPQGVTDVIGSTWPFLPVKVAAAVAVVWLFNDEMLEESPRYSVLLLVAVLAVGLGPGTRDVLRATFGI